MSQSKHENVKKMWQNFLGKVAQMPSIKDLAIHIISFQAWTFPWQNSTCIVTSSLLLNLPAWNQQQVPQHFSLPRQFWETFSGLTEDFLKGSGGAARKEREQGRRISPNYCCRRFLQ